MFASVRLFLLGVLSLFVVAGCGVRLAYSQLDWLVPWYLSDYVSFDREQRRLLDARLADRLTWHCSSQLGPYAELLGDLEQRLGEAAPLDAAALDPFLQRGEAFWQVLMEALVPDAAQMFAGLDDAQVAELAAAFARRNTETRKTFLEGSPGQLRSAQIERMEKRLRTWFGRLQPQQRQRVQAWSDALRPTTTDWLAHRERWQTGLIEALGRRHEAGFELEVRRLLTAAESDWSADYRADRAYNRAQTLALLADLVNDATPAQRQTLLGELAGWRADFQRMACAPPSGPALAAH